MDEATRAFLDQTPPSTVDSSIATNPGPSKVKCCVTHLGTLILGLSIGLIGTLLTFKQILPLCGLEDVHNTWCYQPCLIKEDCPALRSSKTYCSREESFALQNK